MLPAMTPLSNCRTQLSRTRPIRMRPLRMSSGPNGAPSASVKEPMERNQFRSLVELNALMTTVAPVGGPRMLPKWKWQYSVRSRSTERLGASPGPGRKNSSSTWRCTRAAPQRAWATALWPERRWRRPACTRRFRSPADVGMARDGSDHLPRSHGRLALADPVGTDWGRFPNLPPPMNSRPWRRP